MHAKILYCKTLTGDTKTEDWWSWY